MSQQTTLTVEGMTCGHCEAAVAKAVKTLPGVKDVTASHEQDQVVITHEGDLNTKEVKQKVADAGYTMIPEQ